MEDSQPGSIGLRFLAVVVLVARQRVLRGGRIRPRVGAGGPVSRRWRGRAIAKLGSARRAVQSSTATSPPPSSGSPLASVLLGWIGEAAAGRVSIAEWLQPGCPPGSPSSAARASPRDRASSIITVLHIILGELVPKALALLYPGGGEPLGRRPADGLRLDHGRPDRGLLNGKRQPAASSHGHRAPRRRRSGSTRRRRSGCWWSRARRAGACSRQDARLLEGVFEFSEKTAQEVMTPRTQIAALDADLTVEEAADQVAVYGRSRYPVYTDSLDEIIGVVHAKDILRRAPGPAGADGPHHHAPAALRARHPGGGGRAGRHEAAQDPPGHRAGRVRRHRRDWSRWRTCWRRSSGPIYDEYDPAGPDRRPPTALPASTAP